ncbi:ribosome maturation factor RimM [Motilibacter aurantiacus]|uniref:ribosome maturation factor RimM n=1 Tax=Motilibacter aurantiacus TaxID=2714955 RepID=UPI0014096904|nr:ribosome maturation factor RimM [Motilibacter aurantiacus]NHC44637.1 ribosome maturation factor RimM [Motilibacter aurantiacus]
MSTSGAEGRPSTVELVVGRIGRAHGIRGDVLVDVRTDDPELRFAAGASLRTDPAVVGPLVVESGRVHSGRLVLRFEGVSDRTRAEQLRGTMLLVDVPADEEPEDPEEFFDHQLIGLAAVLPSGEPVGEVVDVLHLPAQDVLAVRRPDGREALVPFVTEIVPEVDVPGGRIVVDPPAGLLDALEDETAAEDARDAAPGDEAPGTGTPSGSA